MRDFKANLGRAPKALRISIWLVVWGLLHLGTAAVLAVSWLLVLWFLPVLVLAVGWPDYVLPDWSRWVFVVVSGVWGLLGLWVFRSYIKGALKDMIEIVDEFP